MIRFFLLLSISAATVCLFGGQLVAFQGGISMPKEPRASKPVSIPQTSDPNVAYKMGVGYYNERKFDEAVAAFEMALRLNPSQSQTYYALGLAYRAKNEYKTASETFAKAIGITPGWIDPYVRKAEVDVGRGKPAEAEATALKAVQVKPDSAEAYYWLGYSRISLKKYDDALGNFQQALKLKPDYPAAYTELGQVYQSLKQNKEAVGAYEKAIKLDPKYRKAHEMLGYLLVELKDFKYAEEECQRLAELNDPTLGIIKSRLDRSKRMVAASEALDKNPNDAGALVEYGLATMDGEPWVVDGRFEKAKEYFRKAISLKPDLAAAHLHLGECYVETKDRNSADAELAVLKQLDKSSSLLLEKRIKDGPTQGGFRGTSVDK